MISPAFASLLRDGRADLNTRFQAARHRYPELDAATFQRFLAEAVDPLVSALAVRAPAATPAFVQAAYDSALDLCGQRLVGASARLPALTQLWRELLPAALPFLAVAPARLLAALGNAVHQLATTPGARPAEWMTAMREGLAQCPDADTWLRLGQFLAWRCGLSHYRSSALALADHLPEQLVAAQLGAPGADWSSLRAAVAADPWWQPGTRAPLTEADRVGSFSGFGGAFTTLPRVAAVGEQLFALSGDDCWLVVADRFGCTLHRATAAEHKAARAARPAPLETRGNRLRWQGAELELPDLDSIDSQARNRHTVLLASPETYAIVIVALAGDGA